MIANFAPFTRRGLGFKYAATTFKYKSVTFLHRLPDLISLYDAEQSIFLKMPVSCQSSIYNIQNPVLALGTALIRMSVESLNTRYYIFLKLLIRHSLSNDGTNSTYILERFQWWNVRKRIKNRLLAGLGS